MSLEEIAAFTSDGCILERLQQGIMPAEPVGRRITILQQHRERLLATADEKLAYYERYLTSSRL